MIRLKQTIAVVLTLMMLLPLVTPAVLQLQQVYMQWEMQENLEKKELVSITLSATDIHWVHKEKECLINGELFDVKEKQINEGKITLTGLFDVKEKQIQKQISSHAQKQQQDRKRAVLLKMLVQTATVFQRSELLNPPCLLTTSYQPIFKQAFYKNPFCGIVTPPPRCIS